MQSTIDSRYEINEDGIWIQEYTSPFIIDVKKVYPTKLTQNMKNDITHYNSLYNKLHTEAVSLFNTKYDICYAFGGGIPKFESYLNVEDIVVVDGMAEFYKSYSGDFRVLYDYTGALKYINSIISSYTISEFPRDLSKKTLFTFIHILEHQTLDEHIDILKNLPKGIDVLVYGPNISKAKSAGWVHIQKWILDHNTFIPYRKFLEILTGFNYEIYFNTEYSDDLLFYFNTGEK